MSVILKSIDEGVETARKCWAQKLNCAESVLRGACYSQGIELPDVAKRMATPFGGGVGRSEDLCGALAGGVLAIGASIGRIRPEDDRLISYNAAGELHRRFLERFGSTSCKVLNRSDFKSSEHRTRCGKFVEECTRFTLETLRKK
jgi:C_GCAxxG_C_C family probable redox protein